MKNEIQKLVSLLRRTFEKGAWHGPSVKEVLQNVTAQTAFNRLPNTHSIIELVAHMTAWRIYVIKKLQGEKEYRVNEHANFPEVKDWNKALHDLEDSQHTLLQEIEKLPEEKLSALVPDATNQYTYYTLLTGLIHHDVYHAGQVILISKATTTNAA